MKAHKIVILLSCILTVLISIGATLLFCFNLMDMYVGNTIALLILAVYVCFYPISFYTCYRLIYDDQVKGNFLYWFIRCVHGGIMGGVFFVPLILSPIFIPDYIHYYKHDKQEYNRKREYAKTILKIDNE